MINKTWHDGVFFGLHFDFHASDKDTEIGASLTYENLKAELEKVQPDWIQCDCKGHPGWTSWPTEVGSASPGIVNDPLRIHADVCKELGIPLVMHYSGTYDERAAILHPDWVQLDKDGKANALGFTCNLSDYTEKLMIPQMLEVIDKYDVDGFWVDGDCWASAPCYCPRCKDAYFKQTGMMVPPTSPEDAAWPIWAEFHRKHFYNHVRKYVEAVHTHKPSCTVASNWMYTIGDPDVLDVPVDYLSGDFAHVWGSDWANREGRYLASRGKGWDLMAWAFATSEDAMRGWSFKTSAGICQEIACVFALGGAVSVYDNPLRSGKLVSWHEDILADVGRFARARKQWCVGTKSVPQVAILHDSASYFAKAGEKLMVPGVQGFQAVAGALHSLLENHYQVDILDERMLSERIDDFELVVVPEQDKVSESLKARIADYAKHGGKVIVSGAIAAIGFGDLCGVEPKGVSECDFLYIPVGDQAATIRGPYENVELAGARAFKTAISQVEYAPGKELTSIVTINNYGKGRVAGIYTPFFEHYMASHYPRSRQLVKEIVDALGCDFVVTMDAPAVLQISLRTLEELLIVHLVNLGADFPTAPGRVFVENVPPIENVKLQIKIDRKPKCIYLAPSMSPLEWSWEKGIAQIEVASVRIMDSVVVER